MNSEKLNRWLTLGSNLGVFAGLILVAYEISQSGKHLELAASADGTDNFTQAIEILVQDENLSRLIYKAEQFYGDLDEFEKWRVSRYLDGFMTMSQQDFLVYLEISDDGTVSGYEYDWRRNMKLAMFQDYWLHNEARYNPKYQNFINGILAESSGL